MRLSLRYVNTIKKYFCEFFGEGDVFLFGSRTDDSKRGVDIDLYWVVKNHDNLFEKKIKLLSRIKQIGIINVDKWFEIKDLRNEIAHEYEDSNDV